MTKKTLLWIFVFFLISSGAFALDTLFGYNGSTAIYYGMDIGDDNNFERYHFNCYNASYYGITSGVYTISHINYHQGDFSSDGLPQVNFTLHTWDATNNKPNLTSYTDQNGDTCVLTVDPDDHTDNQYTGQLALTSSCIYDFNLNRPEICVLGRMLSNPDGDKKMYVSGLNADADLGTIGQWYKVDSAWGAALADGTLRERSPNIMFYGSEYIPDTTIPSFDAFLINTTTIRRNQSIQANVTLKDNQNGASWYFTYNDGFAVNKNLTNSTWAGTSQDVGVAWVVNATRGTSVTYKWHAIDANENRNTSQQLNFTITNTAPFITLKNNTSPITSLKPYVILNFTPSDIDNDPNLVTYVWVNSSTIPYYVYSTTSSTGINISLWPNGNYSVKFSVNDSYAMSSNSSEIKVTINALTADNITLLYPTGGITVDNSSDIVFNTSNGVDFGLYCYLYTNETGTYGISGTIGPGVNHDQNHTFPIGGLPQGGYAYYVNCTSGDMQQLSDNATFYLQLDYENPGISLSGENAWTATNKSTINQYGNGTFPIRINFTDNHDLYGFYINISLEGETIHSLLNQSLSGESYFYSHDLSMSNASKWRVGVYDITLIVADSHTASRIEPYNIKRGTNSLEYNTAEGRNIKVTAQGAIKSDTTKNLDRYTMSFDYAATLQEKVFIVECDTPLSLRDTKYNAHFVCADGLKGNWIDFEGINGKTTIKKISEYQYEVRIANTEKSVKLYSIGGLNTGSINYTWYRGNYSSYVPTNIIYGGRFYSYLNLTTNQTYVNTSVGFLFAEVSSINVTKTTSGIYLLHNASSIPTTQVASTYRWEVNVSHDTGKYTFNISESRGVDTFIINNCTGAANESKLLFYIYDEERQANITTTMQFEITFSIWESNKDFAVNYSFGFTQVPPFVMCYSPNNYNLYTDAIIGHNSPSNLSGGDYTQRHYYFVNKSLPGTEVSTILYAVNQSLSDNAFFYIYDENDDPIPDAYVKAIRYYIGNNTYQTVAIEKTPEDGQVLFRLIPFTKYYKFIVEKNGEVLKETVRAPILTTPYYIRLPLNTESIDKFIKIFDIEQSLTYNNVTRTATLSYSDPSGSTRNVCLVTTLNNAYASETYNSTCVTSSASTIYHILPTGNLSGTYIFTSYLIDTDGSRKLMLSSEVSYDRAWKDIYGTEGLLFPFVIMSVLVAIGFYNPVISIFMAILSLALSTIIGFTFVSYAAIGGLVVVLLIFLVKQ